jgi:myo-inositol-1(or 4)-monophosphatase
MNQWNDREITETLVEAGAIALTHFEEPRITVKSDRTPVTEADVEIEQKLAGLFDNPARGSYLIGEETVSEKDDSYIQAALGETAWIVDPIDGTSAFAHGLGSWGISIARAHRGTITEGAILLPLTGELFLSSGGRVRYAREGDTPRRWRFEELEELTPPGADAADARHQSIISAAQGVVKRGLYRGPESVHAIGSCVYSVCYLARGSFSGYIADVGLWDIAAGIAILQALGFSMKFSDGRPITSAVDNDQYDLDPGSRRRFRFRDLAFFAAHEHICDAVRESAQIRVI